MPALPAVHVVLLTSIMRSSVFGMEMPGYSADACFAVVLIFTVPFVPAIRSALIKRLVTRSLPVQPSTLRDASAKLLATV